MGSSIDKIFSEDNMLAYAGACLDLAVAIPDKSKSEGFDTLVIPSRGALPMFLGMAYSLQDMGMISQDHKDFTDNLGIQPVLEPLMPEQPKISTDTAGKQVKVLLAPFTADLNIERFDKSQDNTTYTTKTRTYWANVMASLFKDRSARAKDPYFGSFTDVILRDIEGRGNIAEMYENFPQVNKFSMIDTVISGRASNDILKSFDAIAHKNENPNYKPTAFLIVDENGKKLNPNFGAYLKRKRATGDVEMIYVPRIVSEDEGASLLGISAFVYPSVMRSSQDLTLDGEEFFVGAGSWRLATELNSGSVYEANFKKFMNLVYRAVDAKYAKDYVGHSDDELEKFRVERENFVKHAEDTKILRIHEDGAGLIKYCPRKLYTVTNPYETGSHVAHMPFDDASTDRAVMKLRSLEGVN